MKRVKMICLLLIVVCILSGCADKEAQQAVSNVEELISEISIEDLNADSIERAREAYDKLDEKLKEKISNYSALEEAESKMESVRIEQLMCAAHTTLYLNITGCTALSDGISRVWKSAIDVRNADFNNALSALFQGKGYSYIGKVIVSDDYASNFKVALDTVKEDHTILEEDMRELASLDVDGTVYDALSDLYSEYVVLYNQVIAPSGSYISYTADTNDSIRNINKAEAALDIIWPC